MNKNIDASKLTMNIDDNLDLLNLPTLKGKSLLEILDELEILIEADVYDEKKKQNISMQQIRNNAMKY